MVSDAPTSSAPQTIEVCTQAVHEMVHRALTKSFSFTNTGPCALNTTEEEAMGTSHASPL